MQYRELNFILQATKETLVTKTDTPRCVCLFFKKYIKLHLNVWKFCFKDGSTVHFETETEEHPCVKCRTYACISLSMVHI